MRKLYHISMILLSLVTLAIIRALKIILLITSFFLGGQTLLAQSKKDTLYYVLDIDHIPANDRMITTDIEKHEKFYTINCYCSKTNHEPVFYSETTQKLILSGGIFKKLKLETLPALIDKTKRYAIEEFKSKYVLYIIEPTNIGLTMSKTYLMSDPREPTIDYEIIRPDTTKKKKL